MVVIIQIKESDMNETGFAKAFRGDGGPYHDRNTCNNCGARNQILRTYGEDGVIDECDTKCTRCGFHDFWGHGFFLSMTDGYDSCKKYNAKDNQQSEERAKSD
jgi:hypothetical protein